MAYYANAIGTMDVMPTRNVVLTFRQAKLIERLVSSGRYQNASEVLRDGLRLIEFRAAEEKAKLAALRDTARIGIADIEAGRFRDYRSFEELKARLEDATENGLAAKTR
jgi:antitoxin ParD1/3/4